MGGNLGSEEVTPIQFCDQVLKLLRLFNHTIISPHVFDGIEAQLKATCPGLCADSLFDYEGSLYAEVFSCK